MVLDQSQVIRLYSHRLANSLIPSDLGGEYVDSVTNDLLRYISSSTSKKYDSKQIANQIKIQFLSKGLKNEWIKIQEILESLTKYKSLEQITNYLVFLQTLRGESQSLPFLSPYKLPSQTTNIKHSSRPENQLLSSPYKAKEFGENQKTLDLVIGPYYECISEEEILRYLSYSLLGSDSKLLVFLNDERLELPTNLNSSYSGLLRNILEAALLYKRLSRFVETNKGKLTSPIKTAYLTALNSELNIYVDHVNEIFNFEPSSLMLVYHKLFDWIFKLRLLYSIVNCLHLNGYDFISKVYELTKFGDSRVKILAGFIFEQIITPYYEILEHWIICGDLIDSSDEFFIKFDTKKLNFNEIVVFLPSRTPFFINEDLSRKILQIGKMIIFLSQYCKELTWVNGYREKYSKFIFEANAGLKSMNFNTISELVHTQYKDLLNFFSIIVQEKNEFFLHLLSLQNYLLMKSNDLIEALIFQGGPIFNDSSSNISTSYLSKIVTESIKHSSAKYSKYSTRLDARVLDPTHGHVVWEVFTLEYKLDDLPIHSILQSGKIQYLKMFNFLWRIKHLQYLLNSNFIDACNMRRSELKETHRKLMRLRKSRPGIRERKVAWLLKSFSTVNIIRHQLIQFLNFLVRFISFDIIDDNFNEFIVEKIFKSNIPDMKSKLPISDYFLKSIGSKVIGLASSTVSHNMNELTIDELIKIHEQFLLLVTQNPLLNEAVVGKYTRRSYIDQVYSILEIILNFIVGSKQYYDLITNYIAVLNIEENLLEEEHTDEDLERIEISLKSIMKKIYKDLFIQEFQVIYDGFVKDLKSDLFMREVSRSL
ncbi:uncharacterized protein PRCAT00003612001 [Priceomyces carsonii]|uniref:uncharacterized protein n=1 Tax=Priceomyces carsonii TaxID=28549 RepID=UPI002ED964BC|nr:unnamed protein product [Priceomyces carsonii]